MEYLITLNSLQIHWIIVIVLISIIFLFLLSSYIFGIIAARITMKNTLIRNSKLPRTRECTQTNDEEQMRMFSEGLEWSKQYQNKKIELEIENEGLKLYGEYFDLGYDKTVLIIQGRTESLIYSYYFAESYDKIGYNILVIDVRAHGLSDGNINSCGLKEYKDYNLWINLIHEKYKINNFIIHGICIGGAGAIYTHVLAKNEYVKAIVVDGTFTSFKDNFVNHVKEFKRPVWPMTDIYFLYLKHLTGVDVLKNSPYNLIDKVSIPMLFIYSIKDTYTLPKDGLKLYIKCSSLRKKIAFFNKGVHSHVKINNKLEYNETIKKFFEEQ